MRSCFSLKLDQRARARRCCCCCLLILLPGFVSLLDGLSILRPFCAPRRFSDAKGVRSFHCLCHVNQLHCSENVLPFPLNFQDPVPQVLYLVFGMEDPMYGLLSYESFRSPPSNIRLICLAFVLLWGPFLLAIDQVHFLLECIPT